MFFLYIKDGDSVFDRVEKFIGANNLSLIKSKVVMIVGLGGVGSFSVEALVRSGIENIIIVDYDTIDITNLNRQVMTNVSNIGKLKVDEVEARVLSINPKCSVVKLCLELNLDNIDILFQYKFDYLIDCCDTVVVKQELIRRNIKKKIKFISSMGTGNKFNPSLLEVCDIRKTSYDPIAKKIRKYLRDNNINGRVMVVYSKEINSKFVGSVPSMIFVPASAGILVANYVIGDIINI